MNERPPEEPPRPEFGDPFQILLPEWLPGIGDEIETVSLTTDPPTVQRLVIVAHEAAYDIATGKLQPAEALVAAERYPPFSEDAPETALIRWRTLWYGDWGLRPPWSTASYLRKPPRVYRGRLPALGERNLL